MDEELNIEAQVDLFLRDDRTLRYIATDENMAMMLDFLANHSLDTTHRNLIFAYDNLQDELALEPFREPIPAKPLPPAPTPTAPTPTAPTPTPEPPSVMPAKARTFTAYRNGQPVTGNVRSL